MQTKLTLRMDEELIEAAKGHAKRAGKSLSQVVAEYFELLDGEPRKRALSPRVSRLKGVLRGTEVDRDDYRGHLEKKYG